jgi:hypothetical protein
MTRIVALNKETYRHLKVDGRPSAAHGDNQHFVQVIVDEFSHLLVHYPILFGKHRETGQFFCGAMLGFIEGENQFLGDWQREAEFYRPLSLQRGPFYAHGPELAIDLDDPRVGAESGQALFTEQGQPSRYLQRIIWALQDLQAGIERTRILISRLLEKSAAWAAERLGERCRHAFGAIGTARPRSKVRCALMGSISSPERCKNSCTG